LAELLGKGDHVQSDGRNNKEDTNNDGQDTEFAIDILRLALRERFGNTVNGAQALLAATLEQNRQDEDDRADQLNNCNRNFHKNNTPFIRLSLESDISATYHISKYDTIFCKKKQAFFPKKEAKRFKSFSTAVRVFAVMSASLQI
jgi:hypothetical protein